MEIGARLELFVAEHYPELLGYAAYRRARMLSHLMMDIRSSFAYREHRGTYGEIRGQLRRLADDLANMSDDLDLTRIRQAAKDGPLFVIRCYQTGIRRVASATFQGFIPVSIARVLQNRHAASTESGYGFTGRPIDDFEDCAAVEIPKAARRP